MSRFQILLVGWLAACVTGCMMSVSIAGSGQLVTMEPEEDLRDFDQLAVSHAFEVEIRQGGDYAVRIETDDNVLEHLDVRVSGGTLHVGLRSGSYSLRDVTLRAEVTMPSLRGIELSGATRAQLVDMSTSSGFELSMSGASSLEGQLQAFDAAFELSGASRVELTGGCDTLDIELSGASSARLMAFDAREVDVEASGASQARLRAAEVLSVSASGASHVRYEGQPPRLHVHSSGASNVMPLGTY